MRVRDLVVVSESPGSGQSSLHVHWIGEEFSGLKLIVTAVSQSLRKICCHIFGEWQIPIPYSRDIYSHPKLKHQGGSCDKSDVRETFRNPLTPCGEVLADET
jgi:hypothetical protein